MIGILLITHGTFGESLVQNVCHILNRRPPLMAQLGLTPQDDPLDTLPLARELVTQVDEGDGVLIMTDVLGASPSNLTLKLLEPGRVEGVAGVSLPMVLRALTYRKGEMKTLVKKAVSGGRDGVINMHRQ
ncbi:PTS sugar transporter subunit IIA [Propionivibrio dicarboxylicus]|uniref:PTS system, ascorbate-specific IIA component n=1 Tax=Propionivibrio dicarboxylicus TaxID=83767 RepID=A0A1G7VWK4_9RHOO|nr:PTS fructose transporter subunit IIA [Propionivibrio dicarboxylicus]SDG64107.1 PTS system, ascorbate-specific IIA component [Propionivibrio dicarboxylicus]